MSNISFWKSLACALAGMLHAVSTQRNVRIQLAIGAAVAALAAVCRVSRLEWCLLVFAAGTVLAAELGNTALEALVDLLSPEYHLRAKAAKDVAAGAVLITATAAIIVGLLILGPPCYALLFN